MTVSGKFCFFTPKSGTSRRSFLSIQEQSGTFFYFDFNVFDREQIWNVKEINNVKVEGKMIITPVLTETAKINNSNNAIILL